jgi:hypothetical protein
MDTALTTDQEREWHNLYSPASTWAPPIPSTPEVVDKLIRFLGNGFEPSREQGKWVCHYEITDQMRALLRQRRDDLRKSMTAYDRTRIGADIAEMLSCFHTYARLEADEAKKIVTKYVIELRGLATWAVSRACYQIRTGTAEEISKDNPPSTIRVRALVMKIVSPQVAEAMKIERLLIAGKYTPPATPEQREQTKQKFTALSDDLKASSVDLRREQAHERALSKLAKFSKMMISREYDEAGIVPKACGDMQVSLGLAQALGKVPTRRRKRAA